MSKLDLCALLLCMAVTLSNASNGTHQRSDTLEEEMDNQENILTQLLGDYDKVKTLSEGSDCGCKCVVRPLSRSACQRIVDGRAEAQDFYTVETVTSGQDCKCACIAPPSALNPCEGEFRFKKLQDAGKDEVKLSTIMDLLEGAFYGLDLLKLHSVTTKLLGRVENIEKTVSEYHAEKQDERMKKSGSQTGEDNDSHPRTAKKKAVIQQENSIQGHVAAAFANKEDKIEEKTVENQGLSRPLLKRSQLERKSGSTKHKAEPLDVVIRGVTYYKATGENVDEGRVDVDTTSGDGLTDVLIDEQLFKRRRKLGRSKGKGRGPTNKTIDEALPTKHLVTAAETHNSTTSTTPTAATFLEVTTTVSTVVLPPAILNSSTENTQSDHPANSTKDDDVRPKYRISWTESPEDQRLAEEPQKNPEECKDTLATISDPVTHKTHGQSEGAWMRDTKGATERIYVTDDYYGNNLQEFRDKEAFKEGNPSNSYKLPYHWMGTGHVVYNKAFYYNRAFSRDIIKFDLTLRYVAAWTVLLNAAFDEDTPPIWSGHTNVEFAVDESGLWVIYPALDEESFHQEVITLNRLNPVDLNMEMTWRTALRRNFYWNCFVVCGVLYAIDSYDRVNGTISYAFDTHTNTQMVPRLPFINNYAYNAQVSYNPKDQSLYSWDNGRQVTYKVEFAY